MSQILVIKTTIFGSSHVICKSLSMMMLFILVMDRILCTMLLLFLLAGYLSWLLGRFRRTGGVLCRLGISFSLRALTLELLLWVRFEDACRHILCVRHHKLCILNYPLCYKFIPFAILLLSFSCLRCVLVLYAPTCMLCWL